MVADLVAFLRDLLDDDERIARAACIDSEGVAAEHWQWVTTETDQPVPDSDLEEAAGEQNLSLRSVEKFARAPGEHPLPSFAIWTVEEHTPALPHIARWDPARVLAEVEAKRAILDHHRAGTFTDAALGIRDQAVCTVCHGVMDRPSDIDEAGEWSSPWVQYRFPCPTLRLLALPYASHPEFREEWRP